MCNNLLSYCTLHNLCIAHLTEGFDHHCISLVSTYYLLSSYMAGIDNILHPHPRFDYPYNLLLWRILFHSSAWYCSHMFNITHWWLALSIHHKYLHNTHSHSVSEYKNHILRNFHFQESSPSHHIEFGYNTNHQLMVLCRRYTFSIFLLSLRLIYHRIQFAHRFLRSLIFWCQVHTLYTPHLRQGQVPLNTFKFSRTEMCWIRLIPPSLLKDICMLFVSDNNLR